MQGHRHAAIMFTDIVGYTALMGSDEERALYYLDCAIDWGFSNHKFLSAHNRYPKPLRDDPRFESLLKKAKEKQDKFEV